MVTRKLMPGAVASMFVSIGEGKRPVWKFDTGSTVGYPANWQSSQGSK